MVFSSPPLYNLDPPNWQQQSTQIRNESPHQILPLPLPPPRLPPVGSGGAGSIRPGSMADRARLAKMPQPEAALKCPRCESTNTKFCYYNNYSLSQPRHFCKTCRRYWTRGGALRSVPVGGGCRRNKKNKSRRSKSPAVSERQAANSSSTSEAPLVNPSEISGHLPQQQQPSQFPSFMASLHNFPRFSTGNIGLNFSDIQTQNDIGFLQIGSSATGGSSILSAGVDHWRSQQFPFLGGFESTAGLFPLQSEGAETPSSIVEDGHLQDMTSNSRVTAQLAPPKIEENPLPSLPKPSLGVPDNNQFWGGNSWTGISGLSSSSTSHLL